MATGNWQSMSFGGMAYQLLLPDNYDPSQKYPVLMFLHGGGQEGQMPLLIDPWFNTPGFRAAYPAIVVAPILQQSSLGNNWGGYPIQTPANENQAIAIVQNVVSTYAADANRVYVTGLSLGGHGTWDMMIKDNAYNGTDARIFAAGLSVAGFEDDPAVTTVGSNGLSVPTQALVEQLRNVPIWSVQGAGDQPLFDESMASAEGPNSAYHYTELPLGHDVWDTTYPLQYGKPYYDWLFSQSANLSSATPSPTPAPSPSPVASRSPALAPVLSPTSSGGGESDRIGSFSDGLGVLDPTGNAGALARIYLAAYGRAPDSSGIVGYVPSLDNGSGSLAGIAAGAVVSPEFLATYGNLDNAAFVSRIYLNADGRAPDPAGLGGYVQALSSGTSRGAVLLDIAESFEARTHSRSVAGQPNDATVFRLYVAIDARAPDAGGQLAYSTALSSGRSVTQIADGMLGSGEYAARFGAPDNATFVTQLYQNLLQRAPDPAGLATYTNALASGTSRAALVATFVGGDEAKSVTAGFTHDGWVHLAG